MSDTNLLTLLDKLDRLLGKFLRVFLDQEEPGIRIQRMRLALRARDLVVEFLRIKALPGDGFADQRERRSR